MPEKDHEQILLEKIENGTLDDYDINEILERGSQHVKNALETRVESLHKEKGYIHSLYGNEWDYRDEKGRLSKSVDIDHKHFV